MPAPIYAWNPFQERIDCHVENEVVKVANDNNRRIFVVRAGPFFSAARNNGAAKKFVLKRQSSNVELVLGVDYAFSNTFDRFMEKYKRNVYGAFVLLKPFPGEVLVASYDTIGGPFILDDVAFATLVANIANSLRQADWDSLTGVPSAFPPDPHDQPLEQTYDWYENYMALKSLILVMTDKATQGDALSLIEDHIGKSLPEAHTATKGDLDLPDTANLRPSTIADLAGADANVGVTMDVLKAFGRQMRDGTAKLD